MCHVGISCQRPQTQFRDLHLHKTVTMTGESTLYKHATQTTARLYTQPRTLLATQPWKHKLLLAGSWRGNRVRDQKNAVLKFWHYSILAFCMHTVVCHQRTRDCFCRLLDISLWAIFDVWGLVGADRWVKQEELSPSFLSTAVGKTDISAIVPPRLIFSNQLDKEAIDKYVY